MLEARGEGFDEKDTDMKRRVLGVWGSHLSLEKKE